MNSRSAIAIANCHRDEKGITGLETAIILIAFVTVAAVLAYSVLSAGIFSSEKGKQAVYAGLSQAKASMGVVGGVKVSSSDNVNVSAIKFSVTSILNDDEIDVGQVIIHYTDKNVFLAAVNYTFDNLAPGGSDDMLKPAEVGLVTLDLTDPFFVNTALGTYDTFTIEVIPPTGATITVQRTLPGYIDHEIDLH